MKNFIFLSGINEYHYDLSAQVKKQIFYLQKFVLKNKL